MVWSRSAQCATLTLVVILAMVATIYGVCVKSVMRAPDECCLQVNSTTNNTSWDTECFVQLDSVHVLVRDSWSGLEMRFICVVLLAFIWLYLYLAYIGALRCGHAHDVGLLAIVLVTEAVVFFVCAVAASLLGGLPFTLHLLECTATANYGLSSVAVLSSMLILMMFALQVFFILTVHKVHPKTLCGPANSRILTGPYMPANETRTRLTQAEIIALANEDEDVL